MFHRLTARFPLASCERSSPFLLRSTSGAVVDASGAAVADFVHEDGEASEAECESPTHEVDAEVNSLLERVHSLVPLMSPDAVARTVRKLRLVQRDCSEARSDSRLVQRASSSEDDDSEEQPDPVAELFPDSDPAFASDDGQQGGSSDEELAAGGEQMKLCDRFCGDCSDADGGATSEDGSDPPSPGAARQLAREAHERRRKKASARQRHALPSLVCGELKCSHCMAGGELGPKRPWSPKR